MLLYFLQRLRHIPELMVFLIAALLYWYRRRQFRSHFAPACALTVGVLSIAMPHGNASYMIFLYPFLLLMAMEVFQAERRLGTVISVAAVYLLSQYAVLAYLPPTRDIVSQI